MTRVALLGYGLAGRVFHAPLVAAVPGLDVTHVVTSDPGRREQAARDLPTARLVGAPDELWADPDAYDVVVVATGGVTHVPLAAAALRLGKTVVVDKPLATTAADAADLVRLGGRLTVFQNRRWDADTLTAQALLASGALGTVHRLESRFARFRPEVPDRWREDPAAGGGLLLDLGSHVVDQARLLLGEVVAVTAEIDVRRVGATAEDDVFLSLEHSSGARSHLHGSAVAPWNGPRLVLQGSAAGWSVDALDGQEDALRDGVPYAREPDGTRWTATGPVRQPTLPGDWPAFYALVAEAVRSGGPLPVDPADAVRVLEVLDAARTSAREGRTVRV